MLLLFYFCYGVVAQLVEHFYGMEGVRGSIFFSFIICFFCRVAV